MPGCSERAGAWRTEGGAWGGGSSDVAACGDTAKSLAAPLDKGRYQIDPAPIKGLNQVAVNFFKKTK